MATPARAVGSNVEPLSYWSMNAYYDGKAVNTWEVYICLNSQRLNGDDNKYK